MSYDNSLSVLDVPTSELRRLHVDLIWCYQIVFSLVCLNCDDFFEYCPVSTMRRHPYKLYKKHCNSNVRRNYFSNKMINVWNSLPLTVNFSTLHSFKYSTERVDFKQFLICNQHVACFICVCLICFYLRAAVSIVFYLAVLFRDVLLHCLYLHVYVLSLNK